MSEDIKPASVAEVRAAAAYFASYTGVISIDEEGFWTAGGNRFEIGGEDNKHPVIMYDDPMPDPGKVGSYWVYNPFSTKAQVPYAMRYLFMVQRNTISTLLSQVVKIAVQAVLTNKGTKPSSDDFTEIPLTLPIRDLVAGKTEQKKNIASEIDEKTFSEISSMFTIATIPTFVNRLFVSAKLTTHINIPFLNNEDWFATEHNIQVRKKTLHVVKAIILQALGVEDGHKVSEVYCGKQEDGEPANFSAGMRLLYKVHKALNPLFTDIADSSVVDLVVLQDNIDMIKACTKRARVVTSEKITKPKTEVRSTLGAAQPQMGSTARVSAPAGTIAAPQQAVPSPAAGTVSAPSASMSRQTPLLQRRGAPVSIFGAQRAAAPMAAAATPRVSLMRAAAPAPVATSHVWDRLPSQGARSSLAMPGLGAARAGGFGGALRRASTPVSGLGGHVSRAPFFNRG